MTELKRVTKTINLEMSGDLRRFLLSAKQGDKATRRINANLFDDGKEYEIPTGTKVLINVKKPDGKRVYNTCQYSGSTVTIELTNQSLAAAGTAYCDIEIRTQDDNQIISSTSFTIEVEESMHSDGAIMSTNEFTALDEWKKDTENVNSAIKEAEKNRAIAETARGDAERTRNKNEGTRQQQESRRQEDTSQAIENAKTVTEAAEKSEKSCIEVTKRAESALENQEQLEATLNVAISIHKDVTQMQQSVEAIKNQVEEDKHEIDEVIKNSLLESAEKIFESVQDYFKRAEALYSSMYLDCDGETPYLRTVSPIYIDGATPQVRSKNIGVEFDGGTPISRLLVA